MDRSGIVPGPVRYIGIGAVPFYKTVQKNFDRSAWRKSSMLTPPEPTTKAR